MIDGFDVLWSNGTVAGIYSHGSLVNFSVVVVVNSVLALNMYRWDARMIAVFMISVLAWPLFVVFYGHCFSFMKMSLFYDYYGIGVKIISSMSFWMYWPLCLAICLTVELLIIAYRKMFSPNPEDILREFECGVAEVPGHPLNKSDNKKRKKSRLRPFSVSDLGNTESRQSEYSIIMDRLAEMREGIALENGTNFAEDAVTTTGSTNDEYKKMQNPLFLTSQTPQWRFHSSIKCFVLAEESL